MSVLGGLIVALSFPATIVTFPPSFVRSAGVDPSDSPAGPGSSPSLEELGPAGASSSANSRRYSAISARARSWDELASPMATFAPQSRIKRPAVVGSGRVGSSTRRTEDLVDADRTHGTFNPLAEQAGT